MLNKKYSFLFFLFLQLTSFSQGIQFVVNHGQWSDDVVFKSMSQTSSVTLGKDYLAFTLFENTHSHSGEIAEEIRTPKVLGNWAVRFENVNHVIPEAADTLVTKYNFLIGSDADKWRSNVPSCSRVIYKDLYPNIDLLVYSNSQGIKYDFIVRPLGDQRNISWSYVGVDPQLINGEIVLIDSLGVTETKPLVYQIENAKVKQIDAEYLIQGNRFSYGVGDFNHDLNLVIDPEIVWSTYGLVTQNEASVVKDNGQSILMGVLPFDFQSDWPGLTTPEGAIGLFTAIQCLSSDGSQLEWLALVGASSGAFAVEAVNTSNGILFASIVTSNDFPKLEFGYQNQIVGNSSTVFFTLTSDGEEVTHSSAFQFSNIEEKSFSHYYFYPSQELYPYDSKLILMGSTNSGYLVARTVHGNPVNLPFPNNYGGNSGSYTLISELDFSLQQLNWTTTLGNTPAECACEETFSFKCGMHVGDMTVLQNGNIALCGWAFCPGFEATSNAFDTTFEGEEEAWIAMLDPQGELLAFTYFGGAGSEEATIIAESEQGVIVGGRTDGFLESIPADFSIGLSSMIWLTEFDQTLSNVQWFGSAGPNVRINELQYDVDFSDLAIDSCGNLVCFIQQKIGCMPYCSDFNSWNHTLDAFQALGPTYLFSINRVSNTLTFASSFGGGWNHNSKTKRLIGGKLYFGVCVESLSGLQNVSINPTENAFNLIPAPAGNLQGSMTVFQFPDTLSGSIQSVPTIAEIEPGCGYVNVQLQSPENGNVTWFFGDGESENDNYNPLHTYNQTGEYTIALIVSDASTCNGSDTSYVSVSIPTIISEPEADLGYDEFDPCVLPQVITFSAESANANSLLWLGSNGQSSNGGQFDYEVQQAGEHEVWLEVSNELCDTVLQLSATIAVYNPIDAEIMYSLLEESVCQGAEVYLTVQGVGFDSIIWEDSEGTTQTSVDFQKHYEPGIHEITATLNSVHCDDVVLTFSTEIVGEEPYIEFNFPNVFSPQDDGTNDRLFLSSDLTENLTSFSFMVFNRWGQQVYLTEDVHFQWDGKLQGEALEEGVYTYISSFHHPCKNDIVVKSGTITILR
ncbi:MAG: T9SS type B sorting domain-containing protein [Cryomorphaceae bacterium]|nr:T9SS type B sorting domain-containing protein [Cryomorphaceae bacterium]